MNYDTYIRLLIQWTENKPLILAHQSELFAVYALDLHATDVDRMFRATRFLYQKGAFKCH